jgi:hypothetical protein
MKRIFGVALLVFAGNWAYAAETGPIAELLACKLNPGKTMADVEAANAAVVKAINGVPSLKNYFAAVLVPYRASSTYDYIWLGRNPNLNDWAISDEDYRASADAKAADARLAGLGKCDSGLYTVKVVHDALPNEKDDNDAVLEIYGCTLRSGKTLADLDTWEQSKFKPAITELPAPLASFRTQRLTPWLADSPYDAIYMTVNDDVTTFGKTNTAWFASKSGAASDAAVGAIANCESGLWFGRRLHVPAE